jgi:hypothetical protein
MPDGAYAVFDTRGRKIVSVSGRELLTGKAAGTLLTGVHVVRRESPEHEGRVKKVLCR